MITASNSITGNEIQFRDLEQALTSLLGKSKAGTSGSGWNCEGYNADTEEGREEIRQVLRCLAPKKTAGHIPTHAVGDPSERRWGLSRITSLTETGEIAEVDDVIEEGMTWEEAWREAQRLDAATEASERGVQPDWSDRFAKPASREALAQHSTIRWGASPTEGEGEPLDLDALFEAEGADVLWVTPEVIALVYRGCGHAVIGHLS